MEVSGFIGLNESDFPGYFSKCKYICLHPTLFVLVS